MTHRKAILIMKNIRKAKILIESILKLVKTKRTKNQKHSEMTLRPMTS